MRRDDNLFFNRHKASGSFFSKLINLISVTVCAGCGQPGRPFCDRCYQQLRWIQEPICVVCGNALSRRNSELCHICRSNAHYVRIRSAVWFEGTICEAIHHLKYRNQFGLDKVLGELLVERWGDWLVSADFIIPIPLHPDREAMRGYNQAELLARHFAKAVHYPLELNALFRQRATSQQASLKGEARQNNVQNAFVAHPLKVKSKRILLVDDVCTTGATLNAAALALLESGAETVFAYCVARTSLSEYH